MKRSLAFAALGAIVLLVLLILAPRAALAGWRTAFLIGSAVPVGAVVLLLVARLTGADWGSALLPLTAPLPWIAIAFVPVVIQQALFVPTPAHLALYLAWPLFALRGLAAIGFWWWIGRRLATGRLSTLAAGLALLAHGIVITFVATDWLLGAAPGQPDSAVAMALTCLQIGAATATACLLRHGAEAVRRDLSSLLVAACLGLGYLLFVNYLIVWFGDLPSRVGWYVDRRVLPWSAMPALALLIGLVTPIAAIAFGRRAAAGAAALAGLCLVATWQVAPAGGWLALAAVLAGALVLAVPLVPRARR